GDQLTNDFGAALHRVTDRIQLIFARQTCFQLGERQLCASLYSTQNVVEVVNNTTCQRSQALQFLSGEPFFLDALDFRDVFDHGKPVEGLAMVIKDKGFRQVDPNDFTVPLHIPLLQAVEGYLTLEKPFD